VACVAFFVLAFYILLTAGDVMETHILVIVYASFFAAAFIKGATGLGFVSLCLPVISSFIDIRVAIPLVILPSLLSNVMLIAETKRFKASMRRFWLLYVSAFPGLYAGISLLHHSGNTAAKIVLGAVSIAYSLFLLLRIEFTIDRDTERRVTIPVGLVNGFLNGFTGTQVMPILPYLIALGLERNLLISAINLGFTFSTLVLLLLLHEFDFLSAGVLKASIFGVVPVVAGIYLGGKLRHHLSDDRFRIAVLLILMVIGINLFLTS
jgi:uncharacterized membrane protein YfcA